MQGWPLWSPDVAIMSHFSQQAGVRVGMGKEWKNRAVLAFHLFLPS